MPRARFYVVKCKTCGGDIKHNARNMYKAAQCGICFGAGRWENEYTGKWEPCGACQPYEGKLPDLNHPVLCPGDTIVENGQEVRRTHPDNKDPPYLQFEIVRLITQKKRH